MHIRFFNTYEPVSPIYRDLLPFLAEQGYKIEVIVSNVEYRQGRTPLETTLSHPNIQIRRIRCGLTVSTRAWQKIWVMFSYMLGAMVLSLFGRPTDLNFFLTQPPLFALWGSVLKLFRNQPYHYMVMDMYPDVIILDGLLPKNSWIGKFLTSLANFTLRQADRIVVIGRCMASRIEKKGVKLECIAMIPNWASEDEVFPVLRDENKLRKELGLENKFVVLYSGNLGVSHFFDDILDVACRLQDRTDLCFVFVGGGTRRSEVETAIEESLLSNIMLLPYQPAERLAESLSMGDIHFISLREGFEGVVVPSKVYGALAAGRAILYQGNPSGEIAQMIQEENIGIVIGLEDPDQLENAINCYWNETSQVTLHGQNAYQVFQAKYSRLVGRIRFLQLFQEFEIQQVDTGRALARRGE